MGAVSLPPAHDHHENRDEQVEEKDGKGRDDVIQTNDSLVNELPLLHLEHILDIASQDQKYQANQICDDLVPDNLIPRLISIFPENIVRFGSSLANHHLVFDPKMSVLQAHIAQYISDRCIAGLRDIEDILRLLFVKDNDGEGGIGGGLWDVLEVIFEMFILFLPLHEVRLLFHQLLHVLRQLH